MGPKFVEALLVGKFHGIGPATSAKMNSLGLYTDLDMRNQSLDFMQANFGKAGAYYYWIPRGIDNREVRADRIRKSVGAENTFSSDLTEFDAMAAELQPLIDKVWRYCEDKGARGQKTAQTEISHHAVAPRTGAPEARQPSRDMMGIRYSQRGSRESNRHRTHLQAANFAFFINAPKWCIV
jgi:nucleotidyltransferase/DNA polymerase involved in DNA repair